MKPYIIFRHIWEYILAQNEDCFVYHLLQWTLIRKGCHHGSYEEEEWLQQDQPVHMSTWPLF